MNLTEIIKRVAKSSRYEESEVDHILKHLISLLGGYLMLGEEVKISGLGTFYWQRQKKTRRKHPKTGEFVAVPEQMKLKFRPVDKLRYREIKRGEAGSRSRSGQGEGGRAEERGPGSGEARDAPQAGPGDREERPVGPGEGDGAVREEKD